MPDIAGVPRLGRGLDALLGQASSTHLPASGLERVPLDAIRPNADQPRRAIDPDALRALVASIEASGLVQPIVVRPLPGGRYELIAGERRWRAAQAAGLTEIPALIRDADERERLELGLVENMVREDLNAIEVARAIAILLEDFGQTHQAVADRLGRSRPAVSNLVRLLELPDEVQQMVMDGEISEGHARAVLMADGAAARRRLAERVISEGLSVRAVETLATQGQRRRPDRRVVSPAADEATDAFYGAFAVPVRIKPAAKDALIVELRFPDAESLASAVERLRARPQAE